MQLDFNSDMFDALLFSKSARVHLSPDCVNK